MMKKLTFLAFGAFLACCGLQSCHKAVGDTSGENTYLFAYFPGNNDENLYYAISSDGINYTPLNGGRMVMSSDSVSLKHGIRDPYITRGKDGRFYMVTTDMKSAEGWASNRGIVMYSSDDLIHWKHSTVHFPERFPQWANVTRVWAPEMIWDPDYVNEDGTKGRFMVYFSLLTDEADDYDVIYYSYASDDFTDLLTDPVYLYDRGTATIDGDIVFDDKSGLYHMVYKNEGGKGLYQVTAKTLTAPEGQAPGSQWSEPTGPLQQTKVSVEGAGLFKLADSDTWVLMYDCYGNGYYQFCTSDDLKNFKLVAQTEKSGDFTPRHGSVITITPEEKEKLLKAFPIEPVHGGNPIISGFYADPEILYSHKTGQFYLYPTTDGTPGWGGHEFKVFSSPNLVDWKEENVILDLATDDVPWATGNAWAPSIIEKREGDDYKYYFFFSGHNPETGYKTLGMAVADSPTGPFKDLGQPFVDKNITEGQLIDSDVFFDPRSKNTYFYWGNGRLVASQLSKDMTTVLEPRDITPEGGTLEDYAFREAPYVFYRKGKYYFLWSVDDTGSPNYHVAYGMSDSPLGPITVAENPVILSQNPEEEIYGPAHCSVIQLPGHDEWYIVYHRINKDYLNNDPGVHREVNIDRLEFNKDGTIKPVIPTHKGIEPVRF